MAIHMEDYVSLCAAEIERKSGRVGAGMDHIPEPPLLLALLGEHPEEGCRRLERQLNLGWPAQAEGLLESMRHYAGPEDYRTACDEVQPDGMTELEQMVLEATNRAQFSPNLVLVYGVNFNSPDALAFIDLLDQPITTPVGGNKERIIFGIGRMRTRREQQQGSDFLKALRTAALRGRPEAHDLWTRSSCVMLSDYKISGLTLNEQEYLDNYSLLADLVLLYCSRPNARDLFRRPVLPRLTDAADPFLTAVLNRQSKPYEQIARTLLHSYLGEGVRLAHRPGESTLNPQMMEQQAEEVVISLYQRLNATGCFPGESQLLHLPGGAAKGEDVYGQQGDKSCGVWAAFCRRSYVRPVREAWGNAEKLKQEFIRYFSQARGYSCAEMQRYFPQLSQYLGQMTDDEFLPTQPPGPEEPLNRFGSFEAKQTLRRLCFQALKDAVEELGTAALHYGAMLQNEQARVTPSDENVAQYYGPAALSCMDTDVGEGTVRELLQQPCGEAELEQRLKSYIEAAVNLPEITRDFFSELTARLGDDSRADAEIDRFLNVQEGMLIQDARYHILYIDPSPVCCALMLDADRLNRSGIPANLFRMSGTNGMDRVLLYRFHDSEGAAQ